MTLVLEMMMSFLINVKLLIFMNCLAVLEIINVCLVMGMSFG